MDTLGLSHKTHILPLPPHADPITFINKHIAALDIFKRIVNATRGEVTIPGFKVERLSAPLQTVAAKAEVLEMCVSPGSLCLARSSGVAKMEEAVPRGCTAEEVMAFVCKNNAHPLLMLVDESLLEPKNGGVDLQKNLAMKAGALIYSEFTRRIESEQVNSDEGTASYHGSDSEQFRFDSDSE